MQVGSTSALSILRSTSVAVSDSLSTADSPTTARLKILQNSAKALETLRESMTTSADAAKARAARKLEEAKQQLQMLKSGGFPPEVVARLAAELAHKISAAAAEFASAVAATASSATAASAAVSADAATGTSGETTAAGAQPAAADDSASSTGTDDGSAGSAELDDATQARKAYQNVVEDGKTATSGISSEDRQTMEEFKSILRDVRQLMDKAMRELREKNSWRGRNDQTGIDGAALEAQVPASSTPTSIIV